MMAGCSRCGDRRKQSYEPHSLWSVINWWRRGCLRGEMTGNNSVRFVVLHVILDWNRCWAATEKKHRLRALEHFYCLASDLWASPVVPELLFSNFPSWLHNRGAILLCSWKMRKLRMVVLSAWSLWTLIFTGLLHCTLNSNLTWKQTVPWYRYASTCQVLATFSVCCLFLCLWTVG